MAENNGENDCALNGSCTKLGDYCLDGIVEQMQLPAQLHDFILTYRYNDHRLPIYHGKSSRNIIIYHPTPANGTAIYHAKCFGLGATTIVDAVNKQGDLFDPLKIKSASFSYMQVIRSHASQDNLLQRMVRNFQGNGAVINFNFGNEGELKMIAASAYEHTICRNSLRQFCIKYEADAVLALNLRLNPDSKAATKELIKFAGFYFLNSWLNGDYDEELKEREHYQRTVVRNPKQKPLQ